MSEMRVRYAPSPTGYLHVGGARTAFYNYLLAKKQHGKFILRIEDTDLDRSTKESESMILNDLKWLEIEEDESPSRPGDCGPYRQSERAEIYKKHANKLLEEGKAFYCFCSDEDLEKKAEIAKAEKRPPHYDGTCRKLSPIQVQEMIECQVPYVVRMIAPHKDYVYHDHIRGDMKFPDGMIGDFVIMRSNGMPVYNFCCVIDDYLMKISHVVRGEEHLSNTLRQLIIYEGFGWKAPEFAHVSILVNPDGSKMSKRFGATSCYEFKEQGFLKEALLNFLILLGWSHPEAKEILSLEDMIQGFSLDRCHKSAAVFETTKLYFFNSHYIRSIPDYIVRARNYLKEFYPEIASKDVSDAILETVRGNLKTLKDLTETLPIFYQANLEPDAEAKEFLNGEFKGKVLDAILANCPEKFSSVEEVGNYEKIWMEKSGVKGKNFFKTVRSLFTARGSGPDLKQVLIHLPAKVRTERLHGFKNS